MPGFEKTENEIRYRVLEPDQFDPQSFRRRAFKTGAPRVDAIMGKIKGSSTMTIQALRFPLEDGWTEEKARTWINEHFNAETASIRGALRELAAGAAGAPSEFLVLPRGTLRLADGPERIVDDSAMDSILAAHQARGIEPVIDYEHQTEGGAYASPDGTAPAAGWIKRLRRGDDGIHAEVEWTDRARELISKKEYRYYSPVYNVEKGTGRILALLRVALTNAPRFNQLRPLVAKGPAPLQTSTADDAGTLEGGSMEFLKKLAALLGLPESATEDQVAEKITALTKAAPEAAKAVETAKAVIEELGLAETSPPDAIMGAIRGLKARPAGPDPELAKQVTELRAWKAEREAAELVDRVMAEGKISAAQRNWALETAKAQPAFFTEWAKNAPVVVPVHELEAAKSKTSSGAGGLTPEEAVIKKQLNISDDDWQKYAGKGE
jgi:phage I-like protein